MTEPDETMSITTRRDGETTVVVLSGELDLYSSEQLTNALAVALEDSPKEIGVDAGGLTFTDSAGLRSLLVARDAAEADGVAFRLTHVSDHLDRLLEMTGLREILGVPVT